MKGRLLGVIFLGIFLFSIIGVLANGSCQEKDGYCAENVAQDSCVGEGLTYTEGGTCEKLCCVYGGEGHYVSGESCGKSSSAEGFSSENVEVITGISQSECWEVSETIENVACVLGNEFSKRCKILPSAECNQEGGEAYRDTYCSDRELEKAYNNAWDYAPRSGKTCFGGDLYESDEKGNREKFIGCEKGKERCVEESFNNAGCVSTVCEVTNLKKEGFSEENASLILGKETSRNNGESWCVYFGKIGNSTKDITVKEAYANLPDIPTKDDDWKEFKVDKNYAQDVVGSEHYRFYCDQGKVVRDEKGDMRKKVCVQTVQENGTTKAKLVDNTYESCLSLTKQYAEDVKEIIDASECHGEEIDNSCDDDNDPLGELGANYDIIVDDLDDLRAEVRERGKVLRKDCLENSQCIFKYVAVSEDYTDKNDQGTPDYNLFELASCLPKYPPGRDLSIPSKKTGSEDKKESKKEGQENLCSIASTSCTVYFNVEGGEDWKCIRNCECLGKGNYNEKNKEKNFLKKMNDMCISIGDCGSYFNINEVATNNIDVKIQKIRSDMEYDDIYLTNEYQNEGENALVDNVDSPTTAKKKLKSYILKQFNLSAVKERYTDSLNFKKDQSARSLVKNILPGVTLTPFSIPLVYKWDGWGYEYSGRVREITVDFECKPWEAPKGGEDCSLCNNDELGRPCTKYRCNSLGSSCEIVEGEGENPICISRAGTNVPPVISFKGASDDLKKEEEQNGYIKLEKRDGTKIIEGNLLEFSLETDRATKCKYDFEGFEKNIEKISESEESRSDYLNHYFKVTLPDISEGKREGVVDGNGCVTTHVLCEDTQEIPLSDEFKVEVCLASISESAGVKDFNFIKPSGSYAPLEGAFAFSMGIDKKASCKYSRNENTPYEEMENTLDCGGGPLRGGSVASCNTTFTDIIEGQDNYFYIRCNTAKYGNTNEQDTEYVVRASEGPLNIDSVSVKVGGENKFIRTAVNGETVFFGGTSRDKLKGELNIQTSGGADGSGRATCLYNNVELINTGEAIHSQDSINLESQNKYEISCKDEAGNKAESTISFKVVVDTIAPKISSIYRGTSTLNVITNEEASCYYNVDETIGCSYGIESEESESMQIDDEKGTKHNLKFNPSQNYYIKCKDIWDNTNTNAQCKIVRALRN